MAGLKHPQKLIGRAPRDSVDRGVVFVGVNVHDAGPDIQNASTAHSRVTSMCNVPLRALKACTQVFAT